MRVSTKKISQRLQSRQSGAALIEHVLLLATVASGALLFGFFANDLGQQLSQNMDVAFRLDADAPLLNGGGSQGTGTVGGEELVCDGRDWYGRLCAPLGDPP